MKKIRNNIVCINFEINICNYLQGKIIIHQDLLSWVMMSCNSFLATPCNWVWMRWTTKQLQLDLGALSLV